MRIWFTTTGAKRCGSCGERPEPGEKMLEIRVQSVVLWRCRTCAGEPVPEQIPERPTRTHEPAPMPKLGDVARDWKRAQGGDD